MCGVFGITTKNNSKATKKDIQNTMNDLFKFSESRGKESAGLAIRNDKNIYVYKKSILASGLIRSQGYKEIINKHINQKPLTIIGHTRLATDGAVSSSNNQPIIKNGTVGVHNGIIVNAPNILKHFSITKEYDVDTEALLGLLKKFINEGESLVEATQNVFKIIKGSASVAILFDNLPYLLLATNTGSLYVYENKKRGMLVFASEKYILQKIVKRHSKILQIKPMNGCLINLNDFEIQNFDLNKKLELEINKKEKSLKSKKTEIINLSPIDEPSKEKIANKEKEIKLLEYDIHPTLKRCTKCVLPESFPNIEFDESGVCNYCKNYKKEELKNKNDLEKLADRYRSKSGKPDCLVGLSGGRDSSYGLHYVKTVLKMNPIAFTYDWGMVTDLARRNQARLCGKLGVEHIIISANLKKKRENIRKNVEAWLKKPNPGMTPLFMAGDKQYYYYANKLMKQNKLKLMVFCETSLEKTTFKTGFCGVREAKKRWVDISLLQKIKLAKYFIKQFIKNPSYINTSLFNTITAYLATYFIPHNFLFLFHYIKWEEKELVSTLVDKYEWELSTDTTSSWRIGDATASFYNYIHYTAAGFTENDTFRSNQIREGVLSREEALKEIASENKPRYDSLKWYCNIIGIDFEKTIKIINSMPKLYKK